VTHSLNVHTNNLNSTESCRCCIYCKQDR